VTANAVLLAAGFTGTGILAGSIVAACQSVAATGGVAFLGPVGLTGAAVGAYVPWPWCGEQNKVNVLHSELIEYQSPHLAVW